MSVPSSKESTPSQPLRDLSTLLEKDIAAHVFIEPSAARAVLSRVGTQNGFVLSEHGSCILLAYAASHRLPVLRSKNVLGIELPASRIGFRDAVSRVYVLAQAHFLDDQLERMPSNVKNVDFIPYEHSTRAQLCLDGNYVQKPAK